MNKKGFTLVELLGVIVILALLTLLTSTAITKLLKDAKNDLSEIQKKSIKSSAEAWGAENIDKLPAVGTCGYITLQTLKKEGFIDTTIIDPKDSKIMQNIFIKITSTLSPSGKTVIEYYLDQSVTDCLNISIGVICNAIDRNQRGSTTLGTKYNCSVNDTTSYNFYVLSTNGNNVSLIMENNLKNNVEYVQITEEYFNEPATSNHYGYYGNYKKLTPYIFGQLNSLTAGWTNIPTINETYKTVYESITTLTGRTRLATFDEIAGKICKEGPYVDSSNGTSEYYTNCPSWILGDYWTMSTGGYYWHVYAMNTEYNTLDDFGVNSHASQFDDRSALNTRFGIRPVITVNKSMLG